MGVVRVLFVALGLRLSCKFLVSEHFNNVAVTPVGSTFDPLDGLLGKHKTWNSFHDIQVKWVDDENLEVSLRSVAAQPDAEQMSTRVEARHGVALHYTFQ